MSWEITDSVPSLFGSVKLTQQQCDAVKSIVVRSVSHSETSDTSDKVDPALLEYIHANNLEVHQGI